MKKRSVNGSVRGRLSDGAPNPIDVYVGSRVRMRRALLGMSQERLAAELGVTFQQVQKYERGTCRLGASRLWDLGHALKAPISFFYEGLEEMEAAVTANPTTCLAENVAQVDEDLFNRRETLELVRNYYKIADRNMAQRLADLIKALAGSEKTKRS